MSNNPHSGDQLASDIDEIWLTETRKEERHQIQESLHALQAGEYTEEEIAYAALIDRLPIGAEDPELAAVDIENDIPGWNAYAADHPELEEQINTQDRLLRIRTALEDKADIDRYPDLTKEEAIERVLTDREPTIREKTRNKIIAYSIFVQYGFAILPPAQEPEGK